MRVFARHDAISFDEAEGSIFAVVDLDPLAGDVCWFRYTWPGDFKNKSHSAAVVAADTDLQSAKACESPSGGVVDVDDERDAGTIQSRDGDDAVVALGDGGDDWRIGNNPEWSED